MLSRMAPAGGTDELERLLSEQVAYYRAVAVEYGDHALPYPGADEVSEALDAFQPAGSVLELACGPGTWTGQLLRYATEITAVDASAEMLAIASARVSDQRVRFVQADVFTWEPDRRYDVVFFGFGCHTCRRNASGLSGHWSPTASNRMAACSLSTTGTEPRTSSSRANHPRPSVDA